jgi:hypothetical protein
MQHARLWRGRPLLCAANGITIGNCKENLERKHPNIPMMAVSGAHSLTYSRGRDEPIVSVHLEG